MGLLIGRVFQHRVRFGRSQNHLRFQLIVVVVIRWWVGWFSRGCPVRAAEVYTIPSKVKGKRRHRRRTDLTEPDDEALATERSALEAPIREALENATHTLDSLRWQLAVIDVTADSSVVDQLAAVEQSNVALQEQAAADLQLAQLGMAIEIISHEFGGRAHSRLGDPRVPEQSFRPATRATPSSTSGSPGSREDAAWACTFPG